MIRTNGQVQGRTSSPPWVTHREDPPAPGTAYFGYPQPQRAPTPLEMLSPRPEPEYAEPERRWLHLIGYPLAIIAGLALGIAAMTAGGGHASTAAAPIPRKIAAATASGPTAGTAVTKLARIPGEGTFVVGQDIKPGTYVTAGSTQNCYWARLSGTDGSLDSILANGNSTGRTTVTIAKTDTAFQTSGCRPWTRRAMTHA